MLDTQMETKVSVESLVNTPSKFAKQNSYLKGC